MPEYPTLADLDGATPGPAPEPLPAPASPAQPILEWLESEGFRARVDDDGDILLRHEGRDVFIVFDANDPAYIRVMAPAFWRCDDDAEQRFLALTVANRLNGALKVAKVSLRSDGAAYVAVELFLDGLEALCAVLPRCLDLIGAATWEFRERMKEEQRCHEFWDGCARRPSGGDRREREPPARAENQLLLLEDTGAERSKSFRKRNVSIAACPTRLLPSTNG